MTDIHAHILPFVDDGASSVERSIEMLKEMVAQGVEKVVLTPHYRGDFVCSNDKILQEFSALKQKLVEENIAIQLYLGREVWYSDVKKLIKDKDLIKMNDTEYVLIELDFFKRVDASEIVYELSRLGYKPIVAHIERYYYTDIVDAREIKAAGGYIQINADSLFGKNKRRYGKFIKRMFKEELIDFVASDIHEVRENMMAKAHAYVLKKYGKYAADAVFNHNAKKIVQG